MTIEISEVGSRGSASRDSAITRRQATERQRWVLPGLETTSLFGIPLAQVDYSDVVKLVNHALSVPSPAPLTVDAVNTMGMSEGCLDPDMRASLLSYDVLAPDGMPLVWCMNAKGASLADRVYGPYITDRILTGLDRPTRVGVLGGSDVIHDWLRRESGSRYPNAQFALLYDAPAGPVDEAYVADCVQRIKRARAELVFVCLGVPRQYYWTALARPHLGGRVCISVGGAFDFISGVRRYAPAWMQRAGLTWLHRLAREPRRLGPRYLKYNSMFLYLLLRSELLQRKLPEHLSARL